MSEARALARWLRLHGWSTAAVTRRQRSASPRHAGRP